MRSGRQCRTGYVRLAYPCRETLGWKRNVGVRPGSAAPDTSPATRRKAGPVTGSLAQTTSDAPAAMHGCVESVSSQDRCRASARPGAWRMTKRWECHIGLLTGERERVPACARHDQRSAVRGYVRNTWNRMRGGGGADIRIGSERAGRCGWMASAKTDECPQISGSHTSGGGVGCPA